MPFFEDIGADDEVLDRPIWGVFALLKDNLERLIAANLGWSLHLLPAIVALGFPALPLAIRLLLISYSFVALVPATGMLFRLMAHVCQYEPLTLDIVKEDFHELVLPGFISLAPLFGLLGVLFWTTLLVATLHILFLDTLIRLVFLLLLVCSLYCGALFAEYPGRSALFLLRRSARLVWRYPGPSALTGSVALLAMLLGVISVGGLFLIVPVVVALLQTRRYYELQQREQRRQHRHAVRHGTSSSARKDMTEVGI